MEHWYDYCAESRPWPRLARTALFTFVFYFLSGQMFRFIGSPMAPTRGWISFLVDRLSLFFSVIGVVFLTFVVVDAYLTVARLLRSLHERKGDLFEVECRNPHGRSSAGRGIEASSVFAVRVVEDLTTALSGFLYLPAAGLFLMMFSRSPLFDRWNWSPALVLVFVFSFGLLLLVARQVGSLARTVRDDVLQGLRETRLRSVHDEGRARGLGAAIDSVQSVRGGAFASWKEHPMARVLLLPFAGLGAASLLEFVYPLWMQL